MIYIFLGFFYATTAPKEAAFLGPRATYLSKCMTVSTLGHVTENCQRCTGVSP